jgi:uncharacterized protein YdcH (DUF465 family)
MIFGILTLITALCISAVAIYYSVAGLVAIFAAAAVPIMSMGGTLEIAKLVTAVWLHKYWDRATWWLRSYLSVAVVVLMFITSMGIFGFLSKAHIEQTSASEESIARVESITSEIDRQNAIVTRANTRIGQLENSETGADATIQAQIDKEQGRIDLAFERIQPAIQQQNQTIADARATDSTRTKPYEDQLANIQAEVLRLEQSAREYEEKISTLEQDTSTVQPLLDQIAALEEEIIRVTNQLQSSEQGQIRAGQAIIGVTSDGLFGGNTRTALAKWVAGQRSRINQIQGEISVARVEAKKTVDAERLRLGNVIKDIRTVQIPALKERELTMLAKIDDVRQTESPVIQTARDEIQRLRTSAESQVAQSQILIERLRSQLGDVDNANELEADIDAQQARIKDANTEIDTLTEEKIALEAEYRKLEAEVGPIKYIAEFVYGEQADSNMLEEAVRWVIIIIIFVFDPLAVLLLIAAQYTFDFRRKELEDDDGERLRLERAEYERARAQRIIDNPVYNIDTPAPPAEQKEEINDDGDNTGSQSKVEGPNGEPAIGTEQPGGTAADGMAVAREDDDGQVDPTKGEIDGTVVEPTDSDIQDGDVEHNERDREADDAEGLSGRSDVEPAEEQVPNSSETQEGTTTEQDTGGSTGEIPDTANRIFYPEEIEQPKKKVDLELPEELNPNSRYYADREKDDAWVTDRAIWETNNPTEDREAWRNAFEKGEIDSLPWEITIDADNYNVQEGYQQNAEQSDNTLFNKLSKK